MATRPPNFFNNSQTRPSLRTITIRTSHVPSFLRKLLQPHVPNSTQLMGFLALLISGGILLLLTGVTITSIILGFIFFAPFIFITCPIWIPIGIILFIAAAGLLSVFGFGGFTVGAVTWLYRYFMSRRSIIVHDDSADNVKEYYYGREFGGYLYGKDKDTAPGA